MMAASLPLIIIVAILPITFLSAQENVNSIDYGNHNLNWEDGQSSWDEFGHDNSDCGLPRITVEEWEAGKYWEGDQPVLVKNVTKGWAALNNWKLHEILKRYPNAEATMGDARFIGEQGPDSYAQYMTPTTIKEFITKHMYNPHKYFFDRKITIPNEMLSDCHPFPMPTRSFFLEKNSIKREQYKWRDHFTISIGSDMQGLTFHIHGAAWNTVIFGAKRWILWQRTFKRGRLQRQFSRDDNGEIMSAAEWIRTLPQHPDRVEEIKTNGNDCIQRAGEMMFIPDSVAHMVVNIGDTVAVVSEVDIDKGGEEKKKQPDDNTPDGYNPAAINMLNELLQVDDNMRQLNVLRHHLCPHETTIGSDGKIDLGGKSLVSQNELEQALSIAVSQIYEAYQAGSVDHLHSKELLKNVLKMVAHSQIILVECFKEESDALNEFQRDLKKIISDN